MKTLILNGSPRKNGDTAALLAAVKNGLEGEIMQIDAYYANISPCIDCRMCRKKSGCAINDDMNGVYSFLEACDNVLIASPIYFSELTGRLLDVGSRLQTYFSARRFRGETPEIKPKKGAVILTGGGSGKPQKAYETAVCLLHMMNAYDIGELVCSFDTDRIPAATDKEAIEAAEKIALFFNGR